MQLNRHLHAKRYVEKKNQDKQRSWNWIKLAEHEKKWELETEREGRRSGNGAYT